jgi:hypothetical protein
MPTDNRSDLRIVVTGCEKWEHPCPCEPAQPMAAWRNERHRHRRRWNSLLRVYAPLEPWFDKTWKPGDFELVN